ncbi:MAG: DUF1365 domain-containing protein [Rhodospirillales bacterium]|nr:DUF1365 domain-containing protein [Rhodospirillales bacterium]
MTNITAGIYQGRVVHERLRPRQHRLSYGVFSLLVDLDDLRERTSNLKWLSYNQGGFYSIHDRDHGDGQDIRSWVTAELTQAGLTHAAHRVSMLCYPRILGYVFNPLTVFFCYDASDQLAAVIYEVHNTFKERHAYVLAVTGPPTKVVKQNCAKDFYVSPFVPMACSYKFRLQPPGEKVRVVIREEDEGGLLLAASFHGDHLPLSDAVLIKMALKFPLMTLKVMAGIHIEAVRLWLKKAPYFPHKPGENVEKKRSAYRRPL